MSLPSSPPILVTGCAGFIGAAVTARLLKDGFNVVGIDNLNKYYDPQLKQDRLSQLTHPKFEFHCLDISNMHELSQLWHKIRPLQVVHLAAQAGVRYSLIDPFTYTQSNIIGFLNILELCRHQYQHSTRLTHLVYASSSSVYGGNTAIPFQENDPISLPLSLYAATKSSNEAMAQSYHHLFQIPLTGLRFFTVYGPRGRPDMAYYKFTKAILEENSIDIYNHGNMKRDFTHIEDITRGIISALNHPPLYQPNKHHPIYNLGNNRSEPLMHLVNLIEESTGKRARINNLPMQPGDVMETFANIDKARADLGYQPTITIDDGIPEFVQWYRSRK